MWSYGDQQREDQYHQSQRVATYSQNNQTNETPVIIVSDDSYEEDNTSTIVFDNGSGFFKAGIAGDDEPKIVFDSIVCTPKYKGIIESGYCRNISNNSVPSDIAHIIYNYHLKDMYIGREIQTSKIHKSILNINYPIQKGLITSWNDIEAIWRYSLQQLNVQPEERSIVLTEPPFNPKSNREKTVEIMFESFNVPATHIYNQQTLALFATGRTTGIVLDIGYDSSWTVPIYEGYMSYKNAILSGHQINGKSLTEYLLKLLTSKKSQKQLFEMDTVKLIKETLCYVAMDFETELSKNESDIETQYELPDGSRINLSSERFKCCEALFKPDLIGCEWIGIHKNIYDSIQMTDWEVMRDFYTNVVLSGGSTLFTNIDSRLQMEIHKLAPASVHVKVIAPQDRKYMTWIGGSIMASMAGFDEYLITRKEWEETGPAIVHRKCF
eukprot:491326_1